MSLDYFFTTFSLRETIELTIRLFVVINVLGIIPFMLRAQKVTQISPAKATITGAILSFGFLFLGKYILAVNHVTVTIFKAAGGIVLLGLGIEMVFDITINAMKIEGGKDPSVTPLAFPMTIGAGTLTTLVGLREAYQLINIIIALLLNTAFIYCVFRYVEKIEKTLGPLVLGVLQRVMGLLLLSFAIQSLKNAFFG